MHCANANFNLKWCKLMQFRREKLNSTIFVIIYVGIEFLSMYIPVPSTTDDAFLPEIRDMPSDIQSRPRTTSAGTRRTANTRRYVVLNFLYVQIQYNGTFQT